MTCYAYTLVLSPLGVDSTPIHTEWSHPYKPILTITLARSQTKSLIKSLALLNLDTHPTGIPVPPLPTATLASNQHLILPTSDHLDTLPPRPPLEPRLAHTDPTPLNLIQLAAEPGLADPTGRPDEPLHAGTLAAGPHLVGHQAQGQAGVDVAAVEAWTACATVVG